VNVEIIYTLEEAAPCKVEQLSGGTCRLKRAVHSNAGLGISANDFKPRFLPGHTWSIQEDSSFTCDFVEANSVRRFVVAEQIVSEPVEGF
jgi:hypothetical protein